MTISRCIPCFATLTLLWSAISIATATAMEWQARSSYASDSDASLGRHHPIVFANETHAFVLGGSTYTSDATNDFYLYDEATDSWTELAPPPDEFLPRSFGYGVVLNEREHPKSYLGFGASETGERLNDWWEFDMQTLAWKQLTSCPGIGRRHPSMVPVYTQDGAWQVHVGLGDGYLANDQFTNLNDYWSYDIATNSWQQLPDFPSSRRHHPFFFGIGDTSYTGLGHSDGNSPYIERDFYSYSTTTEAWNQEADFASHDITTGDLITTEARVAGTEFSIVLPLVGDNATATTDGTDNLQGAIGFVLSGDGEDHSTMETGEFHAFYPNRNSVATSRTSAHHNTWQQLPPHPGFSRWAPASFVIRGTTRAYFTSGYDRMRGILFADLWMIDLEPLFLQQEEPEQTTTVTPTPTPTVTPGSPTVAAATAAPTSTPATREPVESTAAGDPASTTPVSLETSSASTTFLKGCFWSTTSLIAVIFHV